MTERRDFARQVMVKGAWANEPWGTRHNSAVIAWAAERPTLTGDERMVLDSLHALWQVCERHAGDGFVREHVIIPIHIALSDLLNVELGRLDGGTLSSFLFELAKRHDLSEVM